MLCCGPQGCDYSTRAMDDRTDRPLRHRIATLEDLPALVQIMDAAIGELQNASVHEDQIASGRTPCGSDDHGARYALSSTSWLSRAPLIASSRKPMPTRNPSSGPPIPTAFSLLSSEGNKR